LRKLFTIGWRIYNHGVFRGNYGGDIKFQFGIKINDKKMKKFILELKHLKVKVESKKKMFWILDSLLEFELFQLLGDQKKLKI